MAQSKKPKKHKQLIRIPSRFYVKGKEWKLEYRWNLRLDGNKVDGMCDVANRTITLDKTLDPLEKKLTFLHELGHAILAESHLGESGGLDGFNEEVVVAGYADVLCELFDMKFKKPSCTI